MQISIKQIFHHFKLNIYCFRHKRIKKTSNEQYQYMINFFGQHKLMMKGKLSPVESTKVGELWMQLTKELNNLKGSTKLLQQWKRVLIIL